MVKLNDKDSSEDDEDMNSEQGASAASVAPSPFAELMARDATASKMATNAASHIPNLEENKGRKDGEASRRNWTFGDELEDGDQDEDFLLPPSQKFRPGSIDNLDEQMRFNGLRWTHESNEKEREWPRILICATC
jgi:hypothetical protein